MIAWGRGTGVALKVLPDVFPKVQGGGVPPGVGSVNLTVYLLRVHLFLEVTDSCRQTCLTSLGEANEFIYLFNFNF